MIITTQMRLVKPNKDVGNGKHIKHFKFKLLVVYIFCGIAPNLGTFYFLNSEHLTPYLLFTLTPYLLFTLTI